MVNPTQKMNLKLSNVPTVIYVCFVLHNFCEYPNTYVDEDLIKLQIEVAKRNNEGIDNVPDPIYTCNISEGEVVRRMLIKYMKTSLPDLSYYIKMKIQYYLHIQ